MVPLINKLLITLPNSLQHPIDFPCMEQTISGLSAWQLEGFDVILESSLRVSFEVRGLDEIGLVESELWVGVREGVRKLGQIGHCGRDISHLKL